MNIKFILFASGIAALTSCSTAYRSAQTPDDVYFSPGKATEDYVATDQNSDRYYNNNQSQGQRYNSDQHYDDDYYYNPDDRYLHMMVRNRYRWSMLDNYYYNDWGYGGYGGYGGFSVNIGYGSPWGYPMYGGWGGFGNYYGLGYNPYYSNYWNWNSFYNPYYSKVIIVNPKAYPAGYNRVRNVNLNSYTNRNYYTPNARPNTRPSNRGSFNPRPPARENSNLGSSVRRVFSGSGNRNNYSTPSDNRPVRSYTPPTSRPSSISPSSSGGSSRSSGGSSGGGGGVSRPTRGN